MRRKRLTERQTIAVLISQGANMPCHRCGVFFVAGDTVEREHLHELALGGPDTMDNMRFSHQSCHKLVTCGTKATSAGSSKHRISHAKRLAGENKPRLKRNWPKRELQSRPFGNSNLRKKFDGEVVPR